MAFYRTRHLATPLYDLRGVGTGPADPAVAGPKFAQHK